MTDDWDIMTADERVDFVLIAIENGNLIDAVDFIMHSGDVRVDSVKLALEVVCAYGMLNNLIDTLYLIDKIRNTINTWETT